ncbi:MAG: BUG/TctC family periplasmic protein, partial [uncultured Acetobacteraceae bacterium]
ENPPRRARRLGRPVHRPGAAGAGGLPEPAAPLDRHLPAGRRDRHRRPHLRGCPGTAAGPAGGGGEPCRRRRQHRRAGRRRGGAGRLHPVARHRRDPRRESGALRELRRGRRARLRHRGHRLRHGQRALGQPPPARREERGGAGGDGEAPHPGLRLGRQRQLVAPLGGDPAARRRLRGDARALPRLLAGGGGAAGRGLRLPVRHHRHLHRARALRRVQGARRHHPAPRLFLARSADAARGGDRGLRPVGLERALRAPPHAATGVGAVAGGFNPVHGRGHPGAAARRLRRSAAGAHRRVAGLAGARARALDADGARRPFDGGL